MPVYAQAEDLNNGLIRQVMFCRNKLGLMLPFRKGLILSHCHRSLPYGGCNATEQYSGWFFRPARQFEPVEGYNPYADKNELHGYEYWGRNLQIPDRQRKRRGLSSR